MELYILNSNGTKSQIIDEFSSMIWTHRYSDFGDFQLDVVPNVTNRRRFKEGVKIGASFTKQHMEIEEVFIAPDEAGVENMKITGRTPGTIMEDRIVAPNWLAPNPEDRVYYVTGQVAGLVKNMVDTMCVSPGAFNETDIIPELAVLNQAGTTPSIEVAIAPKQLYTAMKDLLDEYDLGFRFEYDPKFAKPLRLFIYKGVNRPEVEFNAALDNIANESYLNSNRDFKNVALVLAQKARWVQVYGNGATSGTSGLNRKVLIVDASDIDDEKVPEPKLTNILMQRGRTALKDHRKTKIMDGEITNYNLFKFGTHYNLGDTIYIRDEYDVREPKIVSEYIWAMDQEGFRSYPTFASTE